MASTPQDIEDLQDSWNKLQRIAGIQNPKAFPFDLFTGGSVTASTVGAVNLYVDATLGDDLNTGTSDKPFKTIQAAVGAVPKYIKHKTIIHIGSGSFPGFYVEGFRFDHTDTTSLGDWLQFSGTLKTATLGAGTATGTATGGTAGTGFSSSWGTLVDSGNAWTTNALRGLLVEIVSGTGIGQIFPIDSNTSTTITIAGAWTAPNGTSTYAIRDWDTVINTSSLFPVSYNFSTTSDRSAIVVVGNLGVIPGDGDIVFEKIKFGNPTGGCITHADQAEVLMRNCRFANTSGTCVNVALGQTRIQRSSAVVPAAGTFLSMASTGVGIFNRLSNCVIENGTRGFIAQAGELTVDSCSLLNQTQSAFSIGFSSGGHAGISVHSFGNHLNTCVKGFDFNPSGAFPSGVIPSAGTYVLSDNDTISNMSTAAVDILGSNFMGIVGTVGTGNAIGIRLAKGASVQVSSGATLTGTTEVSIDGASSDLATMRAATPKVINNSNYFSKFFE